MDLLPVKGEVTDFQVTAFGLESGGVRHWGAGHCRG